MLSDAYKPLKEQQLVQLCRQDDCEAFDELISRVKPKLYSYILSKTKNESTADEILQIAIIKAWKNIKKYQGKNGAKFLSWMTKIAFNSYYDYFRRQKREVSFEEMNFNNWDKDGKKHRTSDQLEIKLGLVSEGPIREISLKELGAKIKKTFDLLSKEHKEVLELRELQELSCEEISQKINCPYPTVCTRLFYARKNAKKILSRIIKNDN